jgi:hypothetical protein
MIKKCIKYSIVLALIFLYAFKGNLYANPCGQIKAEENEIIKSNVIADSKGTIETAPEVCNGGSFQYNIFKLKNQFGSNSSFSVKQNAARTLIEHLDILSFKVAKIPSYLFYRRILI